MHQGQAARRAAALRAAARGAGLAYWELTHLLANWLLLDRQKNIKWGWRRCGRELCNAFGPSCAHRFFGRFQRQQQRMNAAWLQHAACSCSVAAQQSPRQPPARYPQQQRAPGAAALMSQRRGGGGTVEFVVKLAYNVTAGVHIKYTAPHQRTARPFGSGGVGEASHVCAAHRLRCLLRWTCLAECCTRPPGPKACCTQAIRLERRPFTLPGCAVAPAGATLPCCLRQPGLHWHCTPPIALHTSNGSAGVQWQCMPPLGTAGA